MAVPMIFGQGAGHESTSEASTSSPPQAIFFGFLLHTNPLDAIWQSSSVFSYSIRLALICRFRRQLLQFRSLKWSSELRFNVW